MEVIMKEGKFDADAKGGTGQGRSIFLPSRHSKQEGASQVRGKNPKKRDLLLQPMRRVVSIGKVGGTYLEYRVRRSQWCKVCMALALAGYQPQHLNSPRNENRVGTTGQVAPWWERQLVQMSTFSMCSKQLDLTPFNGGFFVCEWPNQGLGSSLFVSFCRKLGITQSVIPSPLFMALSHSRHWERSQTS